MAIERRMQVYRRKRGSELWHFVPDCSEWPRWRFDERALPAAETLCTECLNKRALKVPSRRKGDPKKTRR